MAPNSVTAPSSRVYHSLTLFTGSRQLVVTSGAASTSTDPVPVGDANIHNLDLVGTLPTARPPDPHRTKSNRLFVRLEAVFRRTRARKTGSQCTTGLSYVAVHPCDADDMLKNYDHIASRITGSLGYVFFVLVNAWTAPGRGWSRHTTGMQICYSRSLIAIDSSHAVMMGGMTSSGSDCKIPYHIGLGTCIVSDMKLSATCHWHGM